MNTRNSRTLSLAPHSSLMLWLQIGSLSLIFLFLYKETMLSLISSWTSRDDYSHGFLIPFISGYFIWSNRDRLKYLHAEPKILSGLMLLLIGGVLLILGHIGSVIMLQQISIIIAIPGLVLLLLGAKYLKAMSLPLAYLIFMIPPILDIVISRLHWPSQVFSAAAAEKILKILDIPVFRSVNFLELPNITLEVANICSGVNYLVSIIAIGIPLAYFTQKTWQRRLALVISAVIIGIITNPLRITLIGIWAYNGGEIVHGPMHIFQGLFVSMVGFVSLFILAWIINRAPLSNKGKSVSTPDFHASARETDSIEKIPASKKFNRAWLVAMAFLILFVGFLYLYRPVSAPLQSPLSEIPLTIGDWEGENVSYTEKQFDMHKADSEIYRLYRNKSGQEVKLYVGYFESQSQKKEMIHYKLEALYKNSEKITIPITTDRDIQINKAITNYIARKSHIFYWYDLNGKVIADRYKAKLITAVNGLVYRKTNGAIVFVWSGRSTHDKADNLANDETGFIKQLVPILDKYLPRK